MTQPRTPNDKAAPISLSRSRHRPRQRVNGSAVIVGEIGRELRMCFIRLKLVGFRLVELSRSRELAAPLRVGVSALGRFAALIE